MIRRKEPTTTRVANAVVSTIREIRTTDLIISIADEWRASMPRASGTISLGENAGGGRTGSIHIKLAPRNWQVFHFPADCTYCCDKLLCNRNRLVWGQGNLESPLMFVGMCPGKDGSDQTGMIFTSGTTQDPFEKLLKHLELTRYDVYLTNLVKCRPKEKIKDVRNEMVRACWPHLLHEISIVKPKLIFAFGKLAATQLCGGNPKFYRENFPNITNSVISDRDSGIKVIPVHHPSWVSYSHEGSAMEMWLNKIGGIFHVEKPEGSNTQKDSGPLSRY